MKKPMSPTLTFEFEERIGWTYEIKYDGFRCIVKWTENNIELISKNGRSLHEQFPEIIDFFILNQKQFLPFLPITFDGELAVLENPYKANFAAIQKRGRMRKKETIEKQAKTTPATYLAFDLLEIQGDNLRALPYIERKEKLTKLFNELELLDEQRFKLIENEDDFAIMEEKMELYESEGMIAKLKSSKWEDGKTKKWMKLKNWHYIQCFITRYEKENGFFHVAIYDENQSIKPLGLFKHGLSDEERTILTTTIRNNATDDTKPFIHITPSICVELKCLELYEEQLREPYFHAFRFDLAPEECTTSKLYEDLHPLPHKVTITNKEKLLWDELKIDKEAYLRYLYFIAPYMLPFLQERPLTVIRYPDGISGEAFYQKNCPDYAPDFVHTWMQDDSNYILCNDLKTLLWLGNQAAIEFHIPFQKKDDTHPSDIIIDLDPPSVYEFQLSVKAALLIKEVCDSIHLKTFVKTSGGKGMQVLIPILENTYSYDETRLFTSFIADYLISKEPTLFTTERMKNKRNKRLYVDYIQHGEGKTIIAPYSARANEHALISTPVFWEEVNDTLSPYSFTLSTIQTRIKEKGCPFSTYSQAREEQPFDEILKFLKKQ